MNEHLFKLKKDGKTVGYLLIEDGFLMVSENGINYYSAYEQSPAGGLKICQEGNIFSLIDFDTSHPFVCKDKNGKDVFVGDRVRRINGEPCFIEWYAEECRYVLHNNQNYYDIDVLELEQGIELIEEKEND